MNQWITYLPESLMEALGWTLVHSLWQGLAIGAVTLLIWKARRNAAPQFRYMVGLLALLAVMASAVLTFLHAYRPYTALHPGQASPEVITEYHLTGLLTESPADEGLITSTRQALSTCFPWLVPFWLLGVLVLSVRLAGGLMLINRLRVRDVSALPPPWKKRLDALLERTGLRRGIQFLLSTRVGVPTVLGILRPVILIPAGMISLMPVEQLESILVHELAHIRRYDFLVNIVQSIIEAVFFYHPVVWMISESVRQEREKCCDDFAIAVCGRWMVYAKALAGLGEIQARTPIPSLALAAGSKKRIILRVERLINPRKMKTHASEKIVAGLLILGSALLLTLSTGASLKPDVFRQTAEVEFDLPGVNPAPATNPPVPIPVEASGPAEKSAPATESSLASPAVPVEPAIPLRPDTSLRCIDLDVKDNVVTHDFINEQGEELNMKFVIRQGEVEELYVNGEKIPASDFPKYQKEIDRTLSDLKKMDRDLRKARQEIEGLDWEAIRKDMETGMEAFRQMDMQELQEQMKQLQKEQFDLQLDQQKIQEEIEKAVDEARMGREEIQKLMEEARKSMEEYREEKYKMSEEEFRRMEEAIAEAMENVRFPDDEELREQIEKSLQAVKEIDTEELQKNIEQAMKQLENMDFQEIQHRIQESMSNLDIKQLHLDEEMKSLDEMIRELEKLELKDD